MPTLHTYRLFISHAWRYSEPYNRLIEYLDAAPNFTYSNYSVPSHDPVSDEDLKEELRQQIRPVAVVLVLAGMYTNHSKWIKFEMDYADSIGKPIVGIRPWGQERTPNEVILKAKEMVGWNTSSIVDAIRRNA